MPSFGRTFSCGRGAQKEECPNRSRNTKGQASVVSGNSNMGMYFSMEEREVATGVGVGTWPIDND